MKKRRRVFALLKALFRETGLSVTLGDFKVKRRKIGKRNLYLIENRLRGNKMVCAAENHNYMCHVCAKDI